MTEQTERLSYRELADRLSISPDAARMKAKRSAKNGRWRIIPGNHPSDRVTVEVPTNDLNKSAERIPRSEINALPYRSPNIAPNASPNSDPNALKGVLAELALAQSRIAELTDLVMSAKDVLTAAQENMLSQKREVIAAQAEIIAAKQDLVEAKDAHRRDAMELAAAETREMGTKAELERALDDVDMLQRQLQRAMVHQRQPWWRKVLR